MPLILNDWTQILANAPWAARNLLRVVTDGTYMYLTGGYNGDLTPSRFSDAWRSADGITWEQLTADGGYGRRSGHGFIYYNNRFWIMGGYSGGGFLNDVWVSDDCITWEQVVANAPWDARHEFGLCEFNGKMVITGGFDGRMVNDVWSSEDGENWTNDAVAIDGTGWGGPREHCSAEFLGTLWLYGGDMATPWPPITGRMNRIYSSPNGVDWTNRGNADWSERREHQSVMSIAKDEIAIVGGYDNADDVINDVWSTTDGINWTEITQLNEYTARSDFGLVNMNGKTFIIGGIASDYVTYLGDVWCSDYDLYCDFTGNLLSGVYPLSVEFTSEEAGSPTSYLWNFGDGETSTKENPTHQYNAPGTYTVSLTVTNVNGSYTETKENYVIVTLNFTGIPRSGCCPLEVSFKL